MKQEIISGDNMHEVMARANNFCMNLKRGQFYNTQMNPLLEKTTKRKTIQVSPISGNEKIEIEEITNHYQYVILVSYFDEDELEKQKPSPNLSH